MKSLLGFIYEFDHVWCLWRYFFCYATFYKSIQFVDVIYESIPRMSSKYQERRKNHKLLHMHITLSNTTWKLLELNGEHKTREQISVFKSLLGVVVWCKILLVRLLWSLLNNFARSVSRLALMLSLYSFYTSSLNYFDPPWYELKFISPWENLCVMMNLKWKPTYNIQRLAKFTITNS